jgi:hypothetical protein
VKKVLLVSIKVVVIKIADYEYDNDNRHNTSAEGNQERNPGITRTALMISMSHVISDGYTYYKIFSFFDSKNRQRKVEDYTKRVYELEGFEYKNFFLSPLFIGRIIFIFTRFFPELQFYKVNKREIQRMKKESEMKVVIKAKKEEDHSINNP